MKIQQLERVISKDDITICMEEYRNDILDNETINKLLKSENDIKKNRTRKATEVIKELRNRYGF